jgi:hypothetical protein
MLWFYRTIGHLTNNLQLAEKNLISNQFLAVLVFFKIIMIEYIPFFWDVPFNLGRFLRVQIYALNYSGAIFRELKFLIDSSCQGSLNNKVMADYSILN